MKKSFLSLRRKAYALMPIAAGVMLLASCAQDGFDDDERWQSDVKNTTLQSPTADNITIEASTDGSQTIITWPVVYGAGGYICSVYDVSNPDAPVAVDAVADSLVDGTRLVVTRAEDTNYQFSITTAGNEELNNKTAEAATVVDFTTFTATYGKIPAGSDLAVWFANNPIDPAAEGELCFDLEAGAEYTMSGDVSFGNKQVTLRTTSKNNPAKVTLTADASLVPANGFVLKYINFDCSGSTKPLIAMSETPDESMVGATGTGDYYNIMQPITINTCNISNLRSNLYTDSGKKYCASTFLVTNSVVHFYIDGVVDVDQDALINAYGGHINNFTAQNSTFYNAKINDTDPEPVAIKYFLRYNNSGRCDRAGYSADYVTFRNCTFYNFGCDQFCNYSGLAGRNTSNFNIVNNIFASCGENVARRIVAGRVGSAIATFSNNTYMNADGTFQSTEGSCAGYDDSGTAIEEDPGFADPMKGDFSISGSKQASLGTGDPRWLE